MPKTASWHLEDRALYRSLHMPAYVWMKCGTERVNRHMLQTVPAGLCDRFGCGNMREVQTGEFKVWAAHRKHSMMRPGGSFLQYFLMVPLHALAVTWGTTTSSGMLRKRAGLRTTEALELHNGKCLTSWALSSCAVRNPVGSKQPSEATTCNSAHHRGGAAESPRPRLALGSLAMALLKARSSFLQPSLSLCAPSTLSCSSSRACAYVTLSKEPSRV